MALRPAYGLQAAFAQKGKVIERAFMKVTSPGFGDVAMAANTMRGE